MKRENKLAGVYFKELTELRQRAATLETLIEKNLPEVNILHALRNAVETMQLGVTITDTEGMIIYTNAAEASMHGYSVQELIGKNVRIFALPEQWQPIRSDQLKEIKRWRRECENIRKDGSTFTIQLLSDIFADAGGNPLGIISTSEDITERKLAEKELQRSRDNLERQVQNRTAELSRTVSILEDKINEHEVMEKALWKSEKKLSDITSSLGEGIFVVNEQGNLTFMNQEAERLIGWSLEELENKVVHDIIHYHGSNGDQLSLAECPVFRVIKTGEKFLSADEVFRHKDGTTFPVIVISTPIMEGGEIVASVTSFRDITDLKKSEAEREKLIEELKNAISKVKLLSGMLPICANCKKIRDDKGYWNQIESYIREHSEAEFSHSICPECAKKLYPDIYNKLNADD